MDLRKVVCMKLALPYQLQWTFHGSELLYLALSKVLYGWLLVVEGVVMFDVESEEVSVKHPEFI
jgi:hypothetical protein